MQTIRDDMSEAGLRRLHLLDGRQIEAEAGLARANEDGGELVLQHGYEDDLGMWHLHTYWRRPEVNGNMVVVATYKGDHGWALNEAAWRYQNRFGLLPNVAFVHEGVTGPDVIEIRGHNGERCGEVKVRRVRWMLKTDVGVGFEEA